MAAAGQDFHLHRIGGAAQVEARAFTRDREFGTIAEVGVIRVAGRLEHVVARLEVRPRLDARGICHRAGDRLRGAETRCDHSAH